MSKELPFQFEKQFEVLSFQIDPQGRIRLSALADLMQEVAWKHANSKDFGKNLFELGLMWVLSRMEIKVHHLPSWGDEILVKTAGRGIDKLLALREFRVEDRKGNVLAEAMSAWILLDGQSKRPQRPGNVLPSELFAQVSADEVWVPKKIDLTENPYISDSIKVKPFDVDMNNHVNNVSYIRWIEDFCSEQNIPFNGLLINYLSEAKTGNEVGLSLEKKENAWILSGFQLGRPVFVSRISELGY